ncbi:MAG TPA: hypothetical protein VK963_03410 [Candidatus Saccharimonadales bacterium]|nr:hypothetical protein [Candidatus Saccharimonadales bacterium]
MAGLISGGGTSLNAEDRAHILMKQGNKVNKRKLRLMYRRYLFSYTFEVFTPNALSSRAAQEVTARKTSSLARQPIKIDRSLL